jgi:hypothetical protein
MITTQIDDMVKQQTSHAATLIIHKKSIVKLLYDIKAWKGSQQSLENMVDQMDKFVRLLPTRHDLDNHTKAIDDAFQMIQEVSTGLTMHMDQYKISESASPRPRSVQAGPSGTRAGGNFTGFVDDDKY